MSVSTEFKSCGRQPTLWSKPHISTYTLSLSHTHSHTHTHGQTHTHTHTHTHMDTHAHTCIHTLTHTSSSHTGSDLQEALPPTTWRRYAGHWVRWHAAPTHTVWVVVIICNNVCIQHWWLIFFPSYWREELRTVQMSSRVTRVSLYVTTRMT